jgi:dipicolinate synthase subunit A
MAGNELKGWVVAVIGGDQRMLEHMRQARLAGATVQHYGGVPGAAEAAGRPAAASLAAAVKGARIVSCPIPGVGSDDAVFAKFTTEKLQMTTEVLSGAAPGALLFTCWSTPKMIEWAKGTPVTLVDYGEDDELAILHAVPTAEGAIRTAIEHTDDTLLGMNVLCFGLGRVGLSVADAFRSMKSKVSLAARNPAQLARAWTLGFDPVPLRDLPRGLDRFSLVISSSSGRVVTREMIAATRPDVVIIDLCSPPGSVDFEAAKALDRKVVWARAQAGRAPRRAGYDEWQVLMRIVRERTPALQPA